MGILPPANNRANHSYDLFDYGRTANETRQAAHDASKPKRSARKAEALQHLRDAGYAGLTRHQLKALMGIELQSVCPIALSLLRDGLAYENGMKRPTPSGSLAAVIVAAEYIGGDIQ